MIDQDYVKEFKEDLNYTSELFYEGEISHDILHGFIGDAERIMKKNGAGDIALRNAYHILIEFLQNICKYSAFHEHEDDIVVGYGAMYFGVDKNSYYIITGNKVKERDKERIQRLVNTVNQLDKKELKQLYIKQLTNSEFNEKQGAGLGFISIKKKNRQPIDYRFVSLDKEQTYYLVKTKVIDPEAK